MLATPDLTANLTERAHHAIKQYILSGRLSAEERLTEDFFAQKLGSSKSPIREALNTLQSEGLVRIEARRGAFVYRFSAKEIADLYQLREALEVFAAATATITPELIATLHRSVAAILDQLAANQKSDYIEEDIHFHAAIVQATGNHELTRVHRNIQNKLWLCRCQTYSLTALDTPDSHRLLAESLAAGDRDQAATITRRHIRLVRDALLQATHQSATTPQEPATEPRSSLDQQVSG